MSKKKNPMIANSPFAQFTETELQDLEKRNLALEQSIRNIEEAVPAGTDFISAAIEHFKMLERNASKAKVE